MDDDHVEQVLAGLYAYDDLPAGEQATVRAVWDQRIDETRDGLDLAAEFRADGTAWVEADTDGNTVIRTP